jgi:hypothetical protein
LFIIEKILAKPWKHLLAKNKETKEETRVREKDYRKTYS